MEEEKTIEEIMEELDEKERIVEEIMEEFEGSMCSDSDRKLATHAGEFLGLYLILGISMLATSILDNYAMKAKAENQLKPKTEISTFQKPDYHSFCPCK
jgi:hypothetical protein